MVQYECSMPRKLPLCLCRRDYRCLPTQVVSYPVARRWATSQIGNGEQCNVFRLVSAAVTLRERIKRTRSIRAFAREQAFAGSRAKGENKVYFAANVQVAPTEHVGGQMHVWWMKYVHGLHGHVNVNKTYSISLQPCKKHAYSRATWSCNSSIWQNRRDEY